jgi:hypothetical protein
MIRAFFSSDWFQSLSNKIIGIHTALISFPFSIKSSICNIVFKRLHSTHLLVKSFVHSNPKITSLNILGKCSSSQRYVSSRSIVHLPVTTFSIYHWSWSDVIASTAQGIGFIVCSHARILFQNGKYGSHLFSHIQANALHWLKYCWLRSFKDNSRQVTLIYRFTKDPAVSASTLSQSIVIICDIVQKNKWRL